MKSVKWKAWAACLPLPVLMVAAWWMSRERLEPFPLLLREMLLVFGYGAALSDTREKRVSNRLVLAMLATWALVMTPQLILRLEDTIGFLLGGLAGALLAGAIFLTVYLISRHGLGGGDVKFMTAAGLYLGVGGVMPTMLAGSVLAAVTGLALIAMKKIDRKGTLPLVPFLYVGIVLTVLFR